VAGAVVVAGGVVAVVGEGEGAGVLFEVVLGVVGCCEFRTNQPPTIRMATTTMPIITFEFIPFIDINNST
jgi:hypothetical protein